MILLALFFILSGAAGLIYESVWARYISLPTTGHYYVKVATAKSTRVTAVTSRIYSVIVK